MKDTSDNNTKIIVGGGVGGSFKLFFFKKVSFEFM